MEKSAEVIIPTFLKKSDSSALLFSYVFLCTSVA